MNELQQELRARALHQLLHGGAELLARQPARPVAVQHLPDVQIRQLDASPFEVSAGYAVTLSQCSKSSCYITAGVQNMSST